MTESDAPRYLGFSREGGGVVADRPLASDKDRIRVAVDSDPRHDLILQLRDGVLRITGLYLPLTMWTRDARVLEVKALPPQRKPVVTAQELSHPADRIEP